MVSCPPPWGCRWLDESGGESAQVGVVDVLLRLLLALPVNMEAVRAAGEMGPGSHPSCTLLSGWSLLSGCPC